MLLRHCILMLCCVMVMGLFTEAEAQGVEEVVYLKNGSVVRGIIVEQIPNETIRIRTRGGSEFVFQMSEVLKITKELPVVEPPGRLPPSPGQLPAEQLHQAERAAHCVWSIIPRGWDRSIVC